MLRRAPASACVTDRAARRAELRAALRDSLLKHLGGRRVLDLSDLRCALRAVLADCAPQSLEDGQRTDEEVRASLVEACVAEFVSHAGALS